MLLHLEIYELLTITNDELFPIPFLQAKCELRLYFASDSVRTRYQ